jgi:hypothetical protein
MRHVHDYFIAYIFNVLGSRKPTRSFISLLWRFIYILYFLILIFFLFFRWWNNAAAHIGHSSEWQVANHPVTVNEIGCNVRSKQQTGPCFVFHIRSFITEIKNIWRPLIQMFTCSWDGMASYTCLVFTIYYISSVYKTLVIPCLTFFFHLLK